MMITIELMGGLGNQLFQIFALLGYSIQHNTPFYFADKGLQHGWRKKLYWDTFLSALGPNLLSGVDAKHVWREQQFCYSQIPYFGGITEEDVKLFGYFQSYKYFDVYKEEIFDKIQLYSAKREVEKQISGYGNSISMHFRLGDYKGKEEHHPIIPPVYYERALRQVVEDTSKTDWTVVYVCEEEDVLYVTLNFIDKLRNMFPEMTFKKLDGNLADWEHMLAMSLCRHNIIANSTFSWFGAYFNTSADKRVYYPSVWFGPAQGPKYVGDLFPEEWQKINIA